MKVEWTDHRGKYTDIGFDEGWMKSSVSTSLQYNEGESIQILALMKVEWRVVSKDPHRSKRRKVQCIEILTFLMKVEEEYCLNIRTDLGGGTNIIEGDSHMSCVYTSGHCTLC